MSSREFDLVDRLVDFAVTIIDIVEALPRTRACNHIAGQLLRLRTSPAPNYGEAQSAESRKDFIHKMKISLKELQETKIWLRIILRKSFIQPVEQVKTIVRECDELIRIFAKSVSTAKSKKVK